MPNLFPEIPANQNSPINLDISNLVQKNQPVSSLLTYTYKYYLKAIQIQPKELKNHAQKHFKTEAIVPQTYEQNGKIRKENQACFNREMKQVEPKISYPL